MTTRRNAPHGTVGDNGAQVVTKLAMRTPTPSRPAARVARPAAAPSTPSPAVEPQANDNATAVEVIERVAESGERTLDLGGWHLVCAANDDEPRVRDIDAAARLGYAEPRMIRKLIKRIWPENKGVDVRYTVERTSMPRGGERETTVAEYWLTEAELLLVVARSETPIALAITKEMVRVYLAVRRYLATHPARRVVRDGEPLPLDRAAQYVNARPARPAATHGLPVLVRTSTGRGAMERELLTVGDVTFTRWHADPDATARIARPALAATLDADPAEVRRLCAAHCKGRPADFLPGDSPEAAEPWLTADEVRDLLPHLAELSTMEAFSAMQAAIELVREHVDTATVHVRAHHRRTAGAARAMLRTLPLRVGTLRAHLVLTPRDVWLAVATEDLYTIFASFGVDTETTRRALWQVLLWRGRGRRPGVWHDAVGDFVGRTEAFEVLGLMLPESLPENRRAFDRAHGKLLAFFDGADRAADRVLDACERTGDWSSFAPRTPLGERPALGA